MSRAGREQARNKQDRSHVSGRGRHRRDVHGFRPVRCARRQDVRPQAADHAARPVRGRGRGHRCASQARQGRHRRRERRGARHHARDQRGDRAARCRHGHAGDGGLQRHPRYGLRAALRPVRPAREISPAAGAAPAAHRGGRARTLRRQRRDPARRSRRAGRRGTVQGAGRRCRRRLLPACLRQSGARGARGRDPARGRSGPVRVRLGRRVPQHARVRALDDDHRQRLHPAHVRPLSGTAGGGPGVAGLPRPALHHGLQRRHAHGRNRTPLPGARARVRGRPPAC